MSSQSSPCSLSACGQTTPPDSGKSTPMTEGSTHHEAGPIETNSDEFTLIVGGLGYIGSHTSWELLKSGKNVVIVDNLSNSYLTVLDKLKFLISENLSAATIKPILAFHQADYRNIEDMQQLLKAYSRPASRGPFAESKITGVIHFAAYKAVADSFQKPLEYYANNVCGLVDFCTLLGRHEIRNIVFSSSATVYGTLADQGGRLREEQCDSSGAVGLTNPYGRSKWMCEAILSDLAFSDPNWTVIALRYFNPIGRDESGILGEDPRDAPNNLMPVVIRAMTGELSSLSIFGTDWDTQDGTAIRDFIHVSDLALGHLAALRSIEALGKGFHPFNLGTGTGHSVQEIVKTMEAVSGQTIQSHICGRREGDVGMCIAEPSKSAETLGWRTKRSLYQACDDICRFLGLGAVVHA